MEEVKKQFLKFLYFLKAEKTRKIKFLLLTALFLLIPTQNYYAKLEIAEARPVIRKVNIDLPEISLYPINVKGEKTPGLTAYSAVVVDVDSKAVLFAKNPDWQLAPASTTKIMTALVALEYYQLDNILVVKNLFNLGQIMGLRENEKMTFENLLYGLLVQSGNDAAFALANNYPGGVDQFINRMNQKAKELNLLNTSFKNPAGIDAYGHFTTVHDLAVLASWAMKNEVFAKIVATPTITITDTSGEIKHDLTNINQLVGKIAGVQGIKTGWTENAGECLIALTQRENKEVITVILASQDRFAETEMLIKWVFENFVWQPIDTTLEQ